MLWDLTKAHVPDGEKSTVAKQLPLAVERVAWRPD